MFNRLLSERATHSTPIGCRGRSVSIDLSNPFRDALAFDFPVQVQDLVNFRNVVPLVEANPVTIPRQDKLSSVEN